MAAAPGPLDLIFNLLHTQNVPHIIEKIFLSLEYQSYKTCHSVSHSWRELLTSQTFQKKARSVFRTEILQDEMRLRHASYDGNVNEVGRLLSMGLVNVNCVGGCLTNEDIEWGWGHNYDKVTTPLREAVARGHKNVVQLLIAGGADPNIISIYGKPPLYEASEKHRIGMVQVLLSGGAEPDKACIKSGRTPLHEAAKCRSMEMVTLLMEKGADPNKKDEGGTTPLDVAVQRCAHQDVIKKLLNGGTLPMREGKPGRTQRSPKPSKSNEYDWIFSKEH